MLTVNKAASIAHRHSARATSLPKTLTTSSAINWRRTTILYASQTARPMTPTVKWRVVENMRMKKKNVHVDQSANSDALARITNVKERRPLQL